MKQGLRWEVETWIADDPDPRDRAELRALLDRALGDSAGAAAAGAEAAGAEAAGAEAELCDRFAGRLRFGTAGLRGAVAAGPNRMNRAVVRAATAAVAGWLLDGAGSPNESLGMPGSASGPAAPGEPSPAAGVVVGCDARHRSAEFADEAARVLAGAGIAVHLLPLPCPTPLVAFAVRHLHSAAGIMITASHNPAADNGYKLYLSDGAQVIPPVDEQIEDRIATLGPLSVIPVAVPDDPLIVRYGDEVAAAYLAAVARPATVARTDTRPRRPLRVVYTPMHGVACPLMLRAIEQAGFGAPHVVAAQAAPDPDFPTVWFPNPEEPGALDLALADARAVGADLVLASDPDGDRLAVAVPDKGADGDWRVLTGDQLGSLLGAHLLEAGPGGAERLVASTIVSATMLRKIAAAAGARFAETLTGFKWITRAADALPGTRFVFGYEEALGYQVGTAVRDKDGIGAALAVLGTATSLARSERTLLDRYDELESIHGVHLTSQLSPRIGDPARVMARLRDNPPGKLGALTVESASDYLAVTGLPPSDVLSYRLTGARVVVRPSGTEPKIKAYLQVTEVVPPAGLAAARSSAARRMAPLRDAVAALLH